MSATHAVRLPRAAHRSTTVRRPTGRRLVSHVTPLAIILLSALVFVAAPPAHAAQGPVGLGTADSFAVLAGSGITNTGPTTITGDVGTFPTPSESGFASVTLIGTNHRGDAVTQGAKNDLVTAYNDAFGRQPVTNVPVELGGRTLLAGVYTSPSLGLTGTLTLDAKGSPDAQFIFKAGSTLITESNSRVLLLNGADPCRVVWQVGSSATFKTGTRFVGDVLAHTSITAQTAATFRGRLLAWNGAVTLDTNTITRANCAAPGSGGGTGTGGTGSGGTGSGGTGTGGTGTGGTGSGGTGSGGTGSTTVGETSTANGTSARYPSAATGSIPSMGAGTASPTGFSGVAPGLSIGTPGGPSRGALSTPSTLAATGVQIVGLMGTGLALLALGAVALVAGRRSRKVQVA